MKKTDFQYVSYLWDDAVASSLDGNDVGHLIYRSNLLGADLRLTNYGGGNTSCKVEEHDPLTKKKVDILWVKGSGGDLGTLRRDGLAGLYLERLRGLENIYPGIDREDEMVELFNHCIFDLQSKAPSIDTPLHAFLPFKHIDHLHPDACIAIAAAKDGEHITKELFGDTVAWVPWQRPGFDLGLILRNRVNENKNLKAIILGSHGLFSWGDTSYDCYLNTLEIVETCARYIHGKIKQKVVVFGGLQRKALEPEQRMARAATLAPLLRGFCSSVKKMTGHFTDSETVLEFTQSVDLERLASMGTSCPDHFLRTKISPLVLDLPPIENLKEHEIVKNEIGKQFEEYRKMYREYYDTCRHADSPPMRDPNPVIILCRGVGLFSFAADRQTVRIAAEFYENAIRVMKGAEAISGYTALSRQEAFNIEYWLLEDAKLKRMPKPKTLSGRVALVTGSGGGIGKSIAKKLLEEGACVLLSDVNANRLIETTNEFQKLFGRDPVDYVLMDVSDMDSVSKAFQKACLRFGGVDLLVNNAGLSISKPIEHHTEQDWNILYDVIVKGAFLTTQSVASVMRAQGMGGDIINIVSKNALVSGPDNIGYGSAKAAQLHLTRLSAAELGKDGIRVNAVNPDAVISGSNIWSGGWAEGRARAYGVTVDELPGFYAKRTLLNKIIYPEDIAHACFILVSGHLDKTTGQIINVDGGIPASFPR